jgi:hypothetical protein
VFLMICRAPWLASNLGCWARGFDPSRFLALFEMPIIGLRVGC